MTKTTKPKTKEGTTSKQEVEIPQIIVVTPLTEAMRQFIDEGI